MSDKNTRHEVIEKARSLENYTISSNLTLLLKERSEIAHRILSPKDLYSEKERIDTLALFEYVQNKIRSLLAI